MAERAESSSGTQTSARPASDPPAVPAPEGLEGGAEGEEVVVPLSRRRPARVGAGVVKSQGRAAGAGGRRRSTEEEEGGGAWSWAEEEVVGKRRRAGEGEGSPGGPRGGPRWAGEAAGEAGWGPRRRWEEGRGGGTTAGGAWGAV